MSPGVPLSVIYGDQSWITSMSKEELEAARGNQGYTNVYVSLKVKKKPILIYKKVITAFFLADNSGCRTPRLFCSQGVQQKCFESLSV